MNEYEPSDKIYAVDMGDFYGNAHRREILEKFGHIKRPDYEGKYRKSLEGISEKPKIKEKK